MLRIHQGQTTEIFRAEWRETIVTVKKILSKNNTVEDEIIKEFLNEVRTL